MSRHLNIHHAGLKRAVRRWVATERRTSEQHTAGTPKRAHLALAGSVAQPVPQQGQDFRSFDEYVRVLLRNRATKLYVGPDPQTWVTVDHAKDYETTLSAIHAALQLPLPADLEILLSFQDPRYDIALPLHANPPSPRNN